MKAQMKVADRSNAPFALIIGEDEEASNTVTVRDMHGESGQTQVPRNDLVADLSTRLGR
jgi:histidyl-tRNA synthetase